MVRFQTGQYCFEWGTTGISIRPYTVFNIYIYIYNDLEDDISSEVLKYADDTKVERLLMLQINKVYRMI